MGTQTWEHRARSSPPPFTPGAMLPGFGSGGYQSFHIHRWNGQAYELLGAFFEKQLRVEYRDLDGSRLVDVILRYNAGRAHASVPWIDVTRLSAGHLISVNDKYPQFYRELLQTYYQAKARLELVTPTSPRSEETEFRNELNRRITMAENIVGGRGP